MQRLLLASGLATLAGADPASDAFVHLFEWSWSDIAQECEDWLGPKGFKAVQVSPPTEHIQGQQWWTRYQPVSYNLTSRSGNEQGFREMVQRCKKAGVDVIADAVVNHVAAGSGTGIAGSPYGNRKTVLYNPEDFHHNSGDLSDNCAVNNYADKFNVQYCDLEGLPDLCTSCPNVQRAVGQYLTTLLQSGVAGFRIDAAKHQDAGELKALLQQTGSLPWVFQEVIEGGGEAVTAQMYQGIGKVTEFNYARQLAPNFLQEGKLKYLGSFGESWGLISSDTAVVFMDNHDTQRGEAQLTYKNGGLYSLANVFMLAHPYGYPKVMSSYVFDAHDQGPPSQPVHSATGVACGGQPWVCEHRYPEIANMVAWRRSAGANKTLESFTASDDGNGAFFCRSSSACVALNRGSGTWTTTVKTSMPAGQYKNVIQSSGSNVEVKADGTANLVVPSLGAVAFHVNAAVEQRPTIAII